MPQRPSSLKNNRPPAHAVRAVQRPSEKSFCFSDGLLGAFRLLWGFQAALGLSGCFGAFRLLWGFQAALGLSGCFGAFRLPETVARLAPSPAPQCGVGLGRGWQFAKLRLPLPLSRKNFRSGNRPHPSPPPQAGEGMRWLICFRLPYASAVSRRKTPVSPLRPGRSPWPGGCRRAFWPAA